MGVMDAWPLRLKSRIHATFAWAPPRASLERLARAENGRSHVWLSVLSIPETSLECDCHGRRPDGTEEVANKVELELACGLGRLCLTYCMLELGNCPRCRLHAPAGHEAARE